MPGTRSLFGRLSGPGGGGGAAAGAARGQPRALSGGGCGRARRAGGRAGGRGAAVRRGVGGGRPAGDAHTSATCSLGRRRRRLLMPGARGAARGMTPLPAAAASRRAGWNVRGGRAPSLCVIQPRCIKPRRPLHEYSKA